MSNRFGLWKLVVPPVAVGTSQVFWDLYNGSDRVLTISSVKAIKDGSVAVSGVVGIDMFLTRTTAVGTGGTEATEDGTSLTAATISKLEQTALPDDVSARSDPSGGATAGAVLAQRQIMPEETNAANYEGLEFVEGLIVVPVGTGLRVVQSASVASVGSVGFEVTFY